MEPAASTKPKGPGCPQCGNRLRLLADQAGQQVICPKCKTVLTVVSKDGEVSAVIGASLPAAGGKAPAPRPINVKPVKIVIEPAGDLHPENAPPAELQAPSDDDAYEPEIPLQRSFIAAVDEPVPLLAADATQVAYDVDWSKAGELEAEPHHRPPPGAAPDYLASAKAKGLLREEIRLTPPRSTFLSGVFGYPWQGANLARWAVMSFGLVVSGEITAYIVQYLMRPGVGLNALLMPILCMIGGAMCLLTIVYCSPHFLAAVEDTANGHDEVLESTVPPWDQWFLSGISLLTLWLMSGAIGFPLSLIPAIGPIAVPIASCVFFPVLVLSALESGSFFVPLSPVILRTLGKRAFMWIAFYFISSIVVATWAVPTVWAFEFSPELVILLSAPALAAVILIYARLLGRLAWKMSGAPMAVIEMDDRGVGGRQTSRPNNRQKSRRLPEGLDAAAELLLERPPRNE